MVCVNNVLFFVVFVVSDKRELFQSKKDQAMTMKTLAHAGPQFQLKDNHPEIHHGKLYISEFSFHLDGMSDNSDQKKSEGFINPFYHDYEESFPGRVYIREFAQTMLDNNFELKMSEEFEVF